MEVPELLRAAGLLGHTEMIKSIDFSSITGKPVEDVLTSMHLVDVETMKAATRCCNLLKQGEISQEQCVFALQTWIGSRRSIEEILTRVGWQQRAGQP